MHVRRSALGVSTPLRTTFPQMVPTSQRYSKSQKVAGPADPPDPPVRVHRPGRPSGSARSIA
eukprot:4810484-Pyramimonas_sp.AAC.1